MTERVRNKLTYMSKLRVGHAANSKLNGEWGAHVRRWMKKVTSGKRRLRDRLLIIKELEAYNEVRYSKL